MVTGWADEGNTGIFPLGPGYSYKDLNTLVWSSDAFVWIRDPSEERPGGCAGCEASPEGSGGKPPTINVGRGISISVYTLRHSAAIRPSGARDANQTRF
jgi:hypothetical protein